MDGRLVAPRWLAVHALVLLAMVGCALLGAWQLDRAREQRDQSVRASTNADLEPVTLDDVLPAGSTARVDDVGRPVAVSGTYDSGAQLVVPGRELDGEIGWLVLAPLELDDGEAIIVIRGWLAGDPGQPPAAPAGRVTVSGWLGSSEAAPDPAVLPTGQVGSVHVPTLANLVPHALRDGFLSAAADSASTGFEPWPAPATDERPGLPLQNVFYAVEWWAFGLAAGALWWSAVRRRPTVTPVGGPAGP